MKSDSANSLSLQGKSAHYPFPHARIKLQRDPKDRSVSGKCNLSNTRCCAAWLPDMLQQCRQTFRTAAPDKKGSVCLPGHHGEMPEAYVYANISFTMLRLHWHSIILCLLLNNTLALLQFPFSVLLWHSILSHHCTPNVNRHETTSVVCPLLMLWYVTYCPLDLLCQCSFKHQNGADIRQQCGRLASFQFYQSSKLKMVCNAQIGLSS